MDAVEFLNEGTRMCNSYEACVGCPMEQTDDCCMLEMNLKQMISIVEQWAKEHPVKTRQSELQKLFPDLALEDGWFCMCPKYVGQKKCIDGPLEKSTCDKCRRDFWMKEIE